MAKYNQTSFRPGHKRSKESIEKQRQTMLKQLREGIRKPPCLGVKMSKETLQKRAITRRKRCIGNRTMTRNGSGLRYWSVLTHNGRRYEHRVIMEGLLGRPLKRSEHVHHRNGNSLDNRPENLQLITPSEHASLHGKLRFSNGYRITKKLPQTSQ